MYISPEELKELKEIDLLSYLESYEPGQLVKKGNSVFRLRDYPKVELSHGRWCDWATSPPEGGKNALSFLIKEKNMDFRSAAVYLYECVKGKPIDKETVRRRAEEASIPQKKELDLPKKNETHKRVFAYLRARGIEPNVLNFCLKHNYIYEDAAHHNAVFVGYDENNVARYAFMRGTSSAFYLEASGSDKTYAFNIGNPKSKTLHLFEAAIDALSYMSLLEQKKSGLWQNELFLSMGGIGKYKQIPLVLKNYLDEHQNVEEISIHFDNDEPGRLAAVSLKTLLSDRYKCYDRPPSQGKDVNEFLQLKVKLMRDNLEDITEKGKETNYESRKKSYASAEK